MLYRLSRVIPVPMRSTYRVLDPAALGPVTVKIADLPRRRDSWWQWRGRIWRHRSGPA